MPRLWPLFYVREGRGIASNDGDLDMGLENLPSLQDVVVILRSEGTSNEEAEQAMAALTHATEMHPQQLETLLITLLSGINNAVHGKGSAMCRPQEPANLVLYVLLVSSAALVGSLEALKLKPKSFA
ncbi:hypothetical protein PVAP13_J007584 [Panicum virgatum]|nr:hypothetical protein PVAP13_J007584 [Panicum virgatum]